jgi:hypothetical protein
MSFVSPRLDCSSPWRTLRASPIIDLQSLITTLAAHFFRRIISFLDRSDNSFLLFRHQSLRISTMPAMSKPLLTLNAEVIYSSTHCKPWDLIKHIGDGRYKTSSGGNLRCYSAHNKELTTGNVEIDLNHVRHEEILHLVDISHLTFADCYIFVHDWTVKRTQTTIIECIKRCKALFLEDTPMVIIGINCHNYVSSPSPFASLPENMQIAEFNFDSEHCMSVKESVLPYLVHQVLSKTKEMRGIGEANLPYKALVPKSTDSILEAIILPINETIDLGRKEMVKKGAARGNRIGKAHMTVCHSDKGEVSIKSLRANAVIVNNPSSKHLILVHQCADDQILELEDRAEVCLLVGTTNTHEEEELYTYVLFTGDAAIDAVSKVKYQAGFSLLGDLRSKEAELGSLLPIIRKSLTEAKEAKMELKILKESVAKSKTSAGILQHINSDEGGYYSSDEDDFNDATQRDPVLDMEFDSLNL